MPRRSSCRVTRWLDLCCQTCQQPLDTKANQRSTPIKWVASPPSSTNLLTYNCRTRRMVPAPGQECNSPQEEIFKKTFGVFRGRLRRAWSQKLWERCADSPIYSRRTSKSKPRIIKTKLPQVHNSTKIAGWIRVEESSIFITPKAHLAVNNQPKEARRLTLLKHRTRNPSRKQLIKLQATSWGSKRGRLSLIWFSGSLRSST